MSTEQAAQSPLDGLEEADELLKFLKHAEEVGLPHECLQVIISDLRRGDSVSDAIWHAQCEWDL